MKKTLAAMLLAAGLAGSALPASQAEQAKEDFRGRISVSGAWALYPMAVRWAQEFQKVHPGVRIDVSAGGAGKGMADCLAKAADLGMISRDIYPEETSRGAWAVAVTKDAVVPTMNAHHPAATALLARGITRDEFQSIFISGNIMEWGALVKSAGKDPIHVYTRSDACGAAETWAKYLGGKQEDIVGIGVYGDPGVTEAVKKDTLGIGFNNINYAYDTKTKGPIEGIRVIPVDNNADGRIDKSDDFYADRDAVAAAIADGRYPSPPARELYFVSNGRPESKEVREFLRWVLSDGQKFVPEAGYIPMTDERLAQGLEKIGDEK